MKRLILLALAITISAAGIARAEDDLAQVIAKLKASVKSGELSKEEARAKLAALKREASNKGRKTAKDDKSAEKGKTASKRDNQSLYKRIEAAVKAGRLTTEQAQAKLAAINKSTNKKTKDGEKSKKSVSSQQHSLYKKLEAAVVAGKITKEQARAKLAALKKYGETKSKGESKGEEKVKAKPKTKTLDKSQQQSLYKQIEAAVLAGKITKEQAQAKLTAIKNQATDKKPKAGDKNQSPENAQQQSLYKKVEAAVKAGKMTTEQARAKLAAFNKATSQKNAASKKVVKSKKKPASKSDKRDGLLKQLKAALKSGKLSKEDVKAALDEID